MKQEEKDLLFKDICARLPYHVRVKIWVKDKTTEEGILDLEHNYGDVLRDAFYYKKIIDIKPYLRPMSSMTEEEFLEYHNIKYNKLTYRHNYKRIDVGKFHDVGIIPIEDYLDWLNAHHFDYRGLIEKGLALEAPEGMYNIKEQ